MPKGVLGPDTFRAEVERRLIDTHDVMLLLGLRTRQAVWERVRAGTIPAPVYTRDRQVNLWDREAFNAHTRTTDRKED